MIPVDSAPDNQFPELWRRSFYLVYHRAWGICKRRLEAHYKPLGLSVRGVWVLMCAGENPCSQETIAQYLEINRNVMVRIVDDLEAHGFIRRVRKEGDRREYVLTPTEKGHTMLKKVIRDFNNVAAEAFRPLSLERVHRIKDDFLEIIDSCGDPP